MAISDPFMNARGNRLFRNIPWTMTLLCGIAADRGAFACTEPRPTEWRLPALGAIEMPTVAEQF